jgi:hypothetical protein
MRTTSAVPSTVPEVIKFGEPVFPSVLQPIARDLISRLLIKEESQRLGCGPDGVADVKQHPFFDGIDWDGILTKKILPPQ